ncbi:unnamed protein product [Closterium sp. Naga37s-1]|nr:unnamed protein product [Closterium sp. Naga37s-1]
MIQFYPSAEEALDHGFSEFVSPQVLASLRVLFQHNDASTKGVFFEQLSSTRTSINGWMRKVALTALGRQANRCYLGRLPTDLLAPLEFYTDEELIARYKDGCTTRTSTGSHFQPLITEICSSTMGIGAEGLSSGSSNLQQQQGDWDVAVTVATCRSSRERGAEGRISGNSNLQQQQGDRCGAVGAAGGQVWRSMAVAVATTSSSRGTALPLFTRLSHGQTPAPPCPFSPLPSPYRPSLPLLTPPCPYFLSNISTNDYDIRYHVRVSLNDSGEPIGVVIKKGADVALTVLTSDATWTNRTLSNAERAKLGGKLTPKGRKGKQPPPPPPPLGYNYETSGTWLSASTLTADNGQTYKELADAMLAAPDTYSALIYTKTFENGVASGAFANVTKDGGEVHEQQQLLFHTPRGMSSNS